MSDTPAPGHPYAIDPTTGMYVMPIDVKYDQRGADRRAAERSRAALESSAEGQRQIEAAAAARERERLARAAERSRQVLEAAREGRRQVEAAAAGREKERLARAAQQLEAHQESARRRWLDAGGTESSFLTAWPTIRDEHLARQVAGPSAVEVEVENLRRDPLYQV